MAFDPVIEHHDIAAEGCETFVLKTAEDIFAFIPQGSGLSLQTIQEILHRGTKVLLQGSKYADYERYKMARNNNMMQMSTPMKGKAAVSVIHSQVDDVFDDGESPGVIVTLQSSPQGAPVIYNTPGVLMQNGPPISTGGHQPPIVSDLPAGDAFDWPGVDFQNWDGGYGDEFVCMEGATTEDFWPSYMVSKPGSTSQTFTSSGSHS
ncbi:uncharacterized protein CLUP02_12080 [Colletotrichum lupini]|uniref:Uncharacterized protein n=1 Tax=Colletotrichum lupini TaxID=145971 RepID=A0A9Q8SZU4_9PEZI|nr:uncharacterized protein CLUP02_12080 [Colletotrichum lupini]UQC86578.1 hypothetical protein CLUP02_12080 [Colletotrichum lupini]